MQAASKVEDEGNIRNERAEGYKLGYKTDKMLSHRATHTKNIKIRRNKIFRERDGRKCPKNDRIGYSRLASAFMWQISQGSGF